MKGWAVFVAILTLAIALSACGKYGPPVRTVRPPLPIPEATEAEPGATEAEPGVPGEEIREPADFDEAEDYEEILP